MLPGQVSPRLLKSVLDAPRNLRLSLVRIGSVTVETFGGGVVLVLVVTLVTGVKQSQLLV